MMQVVGNEQQAVIGLGEFHVARDARITLVCYGIGSCIAFTAFDASSKVAAMAHLVLPDSTQAARVTNPARFIDAGVPLVIDQMKAAGANMQKTVIKIAGGAHMTVARGFEHKLNVGARNIEAVHETLAALGLALRAEDVGGTHGRTVRLDARTGTLTIAKAGGQSYEL